MLARIHTLLRRISATQLVSYFPTLINVTVHLYHRGMETHCAECLRVTVGTRNENIEFLRLLRAIADEKGVV